MIADNEQNINGEEDKNNDKTQETKEIKRR